MRALLNGRERGVCYWRERESRALQEGGGG